MDEKAFKSVVSYFEEYNNLKAFHICFLLDAVKEQQNEIERLENRIELLERKGY